MLTVTSWSFQGLAFCRFSVDGVTLTDPIPGGRTPPSATLPSTLMLTVPLNAVEFLFVVENVTSRVAVRPVLAIDIDWGVLSVTFGEDAPSLMPKSRITPPMLMAVG